MKIAIGKRKKRGASRAISTDRRNSGRNYDIKGRKNINRGLRYSGINKRDTSGRNISNGAMTIRENPKSNGQRISSVSRGFNSPGTIISHHMSAPNLGVSNIRRKHHNRSRMESLKAGAVNIKKSKRLR